MTDAAAIETPAALLTPKAEPLARLKKELTDLETNARAAAKKRLAGSRIEKLLEKLPGTIEGEVDALLERVGLVRKSRLEIVKSNPDVDAGEAVSAVDDAAHAPALEASEVADAPAAERPRREKKRA